VPVAWRQAEQVAAVVGDVRFDQLAQDRGRHPVGAEERAGRVAVGPALVATNVHEPILTGERDAKRVAQVLEAAELGHGRECTRRAFLRGFRGFSVHAHGRPGQEVEEAALAGVHVAALLVLEAFDEEGAVLLAWGVSRWGP